ncbi:MAG: SDR family NAD(P)-dependent oxidoreductase [Nitrospirota bacterium]
MKALESRIEVAVIGIGCRFPGKANNPNEFWNLMANGQNVVSDVPASRYSANRFYNNKGAASAKAHVRKAHFMDWDYKSFDAGFFNFAPVEVEYFDPQQRLLLEVSWEAMENAGLDVNALSGTNVGVYVGGFIMDHMLNQLGSGGRSTVGPNSASGSTLTMLSNRLSYAYDFRGPSLSIDTACSSSLVAFSYAVSDIRNGVCDMALVGGVNFMLRPEFPIAMSKGQFLARDGRSKSFDHRADGYGRGEGAGIVILKSMKRALKDHDRIWAMVDAAGVNQDGRTNGITVPNPEAQEMLMRRMVEESGVDPSSVQYVEAHGTGTPVGDPLEASAISSVYGQNRETPCLLGSVKSNIGHLEAAAGVASLIKSCLILNTNMVPPLATLEKANPNIPFGENGLALVTDLTPLTQDEETRRVAINSFGYGGTNAHVILSRPAHFAADAPLNQPDLLQQPHRPTTTHLLPISAQDDTALRALSSDLANVLRDEGKSLDDVLYSTALRRTHLSNRLAVWGDSRDALIQTLETFSKEGTAIASANGVAHFKSQLQPVFVYTGMGPQWWAMGQELYRENPIFKAAVDTADTIFQEIAGFSIREEMMKPEATSRITETKLAQPSNFVLQYALTQTLQAEGLIPGAVVGHSVGEITSAWASGMLSLRDALSVAYHRSRIQARAAGLGSMLAVGLRFDQAQEVVAKSDGRISIAAVNSPKDLTLAGDSDYLNEVRKTLEAQDIFARPLTVEVPYHSPMMEPLKPALMEALQSLQPNAPTSPLYSTVTGERIDDVRYDAAYWCKNVREPVFFAKAIGSLLQDGYRVFVEVGPHPVLRNSLKEIYNEQGVDARSVQTLKRKTSESEAICRALADVYAQGGNLDWAKRHPAGRQVILPNYPWQRQLLWRESERQRRDRMMDNERLLLGVQEPGMDLWRMDLADSRLDYLSDHIVDGISIMPAAGFFEAMLQAVSVHQPDTTSWRLSDISIEKALVLSPDKPIFLQTQMTEDGNRISVQSYNDTNPMQTVRHASCRIYPLIGGKKERVDLQGILSKLDAPIGTNEIYKRFAGFSMHYGPAFQPIKALRLSANRQEVLTEIELPEALEDSLSDYIVHPSLLDGCFQSVLSLLDPKDSAFLPTGIRDLRVYGALQKRFSCHGVVTTRRTRFVECNLTLIGEDGSVVAKITGLTCSALAAKRTKREYPTGDHVYHWKPALLDQKEAAFQRYLILSEPTVGSLSIVLKLQLEEIYGKNVTLGDWRNASNCQSLLQAPYDAVVFMAGSGINDTFDVTGEIAAAGLLTTLQVLAKQENAPRLYVITQNAFQVASDVTPTAVDVPPVPAQGALVGMTRVSLNELGQLRPTTIDLPRVTNADIMEMLALELQSDDEKDEVALRVDGRFYSELLPSGTFSTLPAVTLNLSETDRFHLKLNAKGDEITAESLIQRPLRPGEMELQLDAISLSGIASVSHLNETEDAPRFMGVCGRVSRIHNCDGDLLVGDRVSGLVPVSLSRHAILDPKQVLLVRTSEAIDVKAAAALPVTHAMARYLANVAAPQSGDSALICCDALGSALAAQLQERGVTIIPFPADSSAWTLAILETALSEGPINILVAPLYDWEAIYGFDMLSHGASLIDLGLEKKGRFEPIHCGASVGKLIRVDGVNVLSHGREKMRQAIMAELEKIADRLQLTPEMDLLEFIVANTEDIATTDLFTLHYRPGTKLAVAPADVSNLKADATYLITGGFGGLGKETAKWLAGHGVGQIVLSGRQAGKSENDQNFLSELQGLGCKASAYPCDTSDLSAVQILIDKLAVDAMPLKGIFHAAGVLEDKPISEMRQADLSKVMKPKALGAWHLHLASLQHTLDHFVMFSSISSLVGNSNQANYSAANGFLDTLAYCRRAQGLSGLSINWGAISSVGMLANNEQVALHLTQIGLSPISFDIGLIGLERVISSGATQICIADFTDWAKWARAEVYGGASPRFRTLVLDAQSHADSSTQVSLRDKLATLKPEARLEILMGLFQEIFAGTLKVSVDRLDPNYPMELLGIDSLMAAQIRETIHNTLGISVSVLELIGDGTISKLANKSIEKMAFEDMLVAV